MDASNNEFEQNSRGLWCLSLIRGHGFLPSFSMTISIYIIHAVLALITFRLNLIRIQSKALSIANNTNLLENESKKKTFQ